MKKLALLFVQFYFSCAPTLYLPDQQVLPAFQHKGQIYVSASTNLTNGVEAAAAYALGNHVAILAKYLAYHKVDTDIGSSGSARLYEGALTYFHPFSSFVFESSLWYGRGKLVNQFVPDEFNPSDDGRLAASFSRFALQPSLTFKSKYIDVALSARIATLRYDNISGQLYGNPYSASAYLRQFPSHTFFEPAFTLKEGWGKIRFYQQVVRNYKWSKADLDREKLSVVLGIQCMF